MYHKTVRSMLATDPCPVRVIVTFFEGRRRPAESAAWAVPDRAAKGEHRQGASRSHEYSRRVNAERISRLLSRVAIAAEIPGVENGPSYLARTIGRESVTAKAVLQPRVR
jgi:hypothetical protein